MATTRVTLQRATAAVVLLVVGVLSLPLSALVLDGEGTENWILPAAGVLVVVVGAVVGTLLPGLAGEGATPGRAAVVGAVTGVVMLLLGVAVFFLLLNGLDGA